MLNTVVREKKEREIFFKVEPCQGRKKRPQGRITLLWGMAGFILMQGGFRLAIDSCWRELRDPAFETKASALARLRAATAEPPETVFMVGSSVTSNAFKAKFLEDFLSQKLDRSTLVFNMNYLGGGPLTELVWTRRLLARGFQPRMVLIEFTPFIYNSEPPLDSNRFPYPLLTESDLEVLQRYLPEDPDARRKWWECQLVPSYGHRLTILNHLAQKLVPGTDQIPIRIGNLDTRFWSELPPRSPEALQETLKGVQARNGPGLKNFSPGKSSLQALEELLQLLKKEKIMAAVVMMPQGPTMRNLYPPEKLERLVQIVTDLCAKNEITFVNAFDWLKESMFTDSIHANREGADLFSKRLATDVLLPALATPQSTKLD